MNSYSIAVVGAGYVGLTAAVGLASLGQRVTVIDIDPERVGEINSGRSPIYEDGLEEAMVEAIADGNLTATTELVSAVTGADFVFLAVGTPMSDMGHADIADLERAFDEVVAAAGEDAIVVIKSTVPVGTYHSLLERTPKPVRLVANPEFLRQGTALRDFVEPERVVLGADDEADAIEVAQLYQPMVDSGSELRTMAPESAALVKYASNAFLATKLSFANEMADLAELSGADIDEVLSALGLDSRIGTKYLNPGPGFGGSCLPKDTMALLAISERFGATSHVVTAATQVNRDRTTAMVDKIARAVGDDLDDIPIAVFGVTFKAGTDDLRDSPAVPIITELHKRGARLTLYDPQGMPGATLLFPWIDTADSLEAALASADVGVILTEWPEFGTLDPQEVGLSSLIDLRNMYRPDDFDGTDTEYISVGRRPSTR